MSPYSDKVGIACACDGSGSGCTGVAWISVSSVAVLGKLFGFSSMSLVTLAVLVTVLSTALASARPVMVTLVLAPTAKSPRLQVTLPLTWLQLGVLLTYVTPAGSVSVRATFLASAVPPLLTVMM